MKTDTAARPRPPRGRKSDSERGAAGAWAYNTRELVELSVEQVIERLPTRYSTSTLRKGEGGSGHLGRRMLSELFDLYRAEAERRGVTVTPPPGLGPDVEPEEPLVEALNRQSQALEALVGELRESRGSDHGAALLQQIPWEKVGDMLAAIVEKAVEVRLAASSTARTPSTSDQP